MDVYVQVLNSELNRVEKSFACRSGRLISGEELSIVKSTRCTILKFILFLSNTLHVSDGLSVHHQESNTVHTASGICHAGSGGYLTATRTCMIYA